MSQNFLESDISRSQIDDPYKRNIGANSYKNRTFDGKRSTQDEYTGKNSLFFCQWSY